MRRNASHTLLHGSDDHVHASPRPDGSSAESMRRAVSFTTLSDLGRAPRTPPPKRNHVVLTLSGRKLAKSATPPKAPPLRPAASDALVLQTLEPLDMSEAFLTGPPPAAPKLRPLSPLSQSAPPPLALPPPLEVRARVPKHPRVSALRSDLHQPPVASVVVVRAKGSFKAARRNRLLRAAAASLSRSPDLHQGPLFTMLDLQATC